MTLASAIEGDESSHLVAEPCGSRSIKATRRPISAHAAARLTAVVVLAVPPFWLTTAITRGSLLNARTPSKLPMHPEPTK